MLSVDIKSNYNHHHYQIPWLTQTAKAKVYFTLNVVKVSKWLHRNTVKKIKE